MAIPNKRIVVENKKVKEENINDSSKEKDKFTQDNDVIVQKCSRKSETFYNNLYDQGFFNKNNKIYENEGYSSGDFSQSIEGLSLLNDVQRQIFGTVLNKFRLLFSGKSPVVQKVMNID